MHLQIPHKFSQAQAIDRVKKGLVSARPQMQGQVTVEKEAWEGNVLSFAFIAQRQHIEGTLTVTDTEFVVEAKLPLLWRMFEKKIEKAIQEQTAGLLK